MENIIFTAMLIWLLSPLALFAHEDYRMRQRAATYKRIMSKSRKQG